MAPPRHDLQYDEAIAVVKVSGHGRNQPSTDDLSEMSVISVF
jgi:hypothetical protein